MAKEVFLRYEKKFLLDKAACSLFQKRLFNYMDPDEYNRTHDFYTISNIYYDTRDNYLIRNSLSKPEYKEKLRLRAYGVPSLDSRVYLEIKKKFCGLVNKRRTSIRLSEAYDFAAAGIKPEIRSYMNKQVINEIEYILKLYDLMPRLYLAYDRQAFFGRDDHCLRITFDRNIRIRRDDLRLESGDYGEALIDDGQILMEIKMEKSMPVWLSKMLSEYRIYNTSFSKYGRAHAKHITGMSREKEDNKTCLKQYSTQLQLTPQYR